MQLSLVESQLLALQDVAVAAARLTGPARDDSVQTTSLKLLLQRGFNLAVGGEPLRLLLLDTLGLRGRLLLLALLALASPAESLAVVCLVPLTEWGGVNLDDGTLGEGVRADEFVVGRVVGDDDDAGLAGAALGAPGKVASIETQSSVLVVTAASADDVNALGADTGVSALAATLESSLLPW